MRPASHTYKKNIHRKAPFAVSRYLVGGLLVHFFMLLTESRQPDGHSEAILENRLVSAGDVKAHFSIDNNLLILELDR
jgi:hypothetical protein